MYIDLTTEPPKSINQKLITEERNKEFKIIFEKEISLGRGIKESGGGGEFKYNIFDIL
jgi:hypothetical protein